MEKRTVQIGIKVTPEVKQEIEKIAERKNRTVSNLIAMLLDEYLATGKIQNAVTEEKEVRKIIKMIDSAGKLTYTELYLMVSEEHLTKTLIGMEHLIDKLLEEHNAKFE